jgi:adenine phosphoribosyltransferase
MTDTLAARLARTIRDVPDFPKPGVGFKDITPVLHDASLFADVTAALAAPWRGKGITHVLAVESRGFLFGAPVAQHLRAALVPVRKAGKLPHTRVTEHYALEYGSDSVEVHADALDADSLVLIVDDVLATGGTAAATKRLALRLGAGVAGVGVVIDLSFLPWRETLSGTHVETLVSF